MRITLRNLEEVEHCVEGVWGGRAEHVTWGQKRLVLGWGTWHPSGVLLFWVPGSWFPGHLSSRLSISSTPHPGPSNATICHLGVSALQRDEPPILPSASPALPFRGFLFQERLGPGE